MDSTSTMTSADARPDGAPLGETRAKIKVWDLPTRVFHWTLAASFAGAWLSAESERWRDVHVVLGITMAGLLVFRVVWGVLGSRHARFANFAFPPSRVAAYVKSLFSGAPDHYTGHNPAGALAIIAMLALGAVVAASGYANYREIGGEWIGELHEGAAGLMLALVAIHIAGVLVSSVLHRENLPLAMLSGRKAGRPEEGIKRSHPLLGALLLAAVLGFLVFGLSAPGRAWLSGFAAVEQVDGIGAPERRGGKRGHREGDDD